MSPLMIGIAGFVTLILGFSTWKRPRLTGALIWSFVAIFMLCALYNMVGPGDFTSRVFLTGILAPLIWVGFQFWLYWDPRRWRIVSIMISASVISAIIILLSDPPI